ncbi:MAG: hypothetical protein K0S41_3004 [Anaerocolumna sp.]|jgi:hypothetical protein|nr:hypothetical protein [Anaerocolumna sp.]
MNLSKSVDFLLENASSVIQYRLRKEILNNLSSNEEDNLLDQIYETPHFKLMRSYVKPNGYIGSGMHSWSNWRGKTLHNTPLEDGEAVARLLSYYGIPKTNTFIVGFINAMRNEEILRHEFSYIPPEIPRFENRFVGINSGNCLMALIYTMQSMLGYGDDKEVRQFQDICLKGFQRVLEINSQDEITKQRTSKTKYNYPYIESDEYFPCSYTLSELAYTNAWRTPENIQMIANSLNHINKIMKPENNMHVKIDNKYYAPGFALNRPLRSFKTDVVDSILYRRPITEIAMLGVGRRVDIIRETAENLEEALKHDGILKQNYNLQRNKRYSPLNIEYPSAYTDVRLEPDYKVNKNAIWCDLTFWAVQFLHLCDNTDITY